MNEIKEAYEKYFKDIYAFILHLSNNADIALDVTQETFYKAIKSIDKFKGTCTLKVWLFQIAKNTYFSSLKKIKNYADDIDNIKANINIPKLIVNREQTLLIYKIIHQLEEPKREVFMLHMFGELSFLEISQIFKKSETWARVTFYRAKLKIKEKLCWGDNNEKN